MNHDELTCHIPEESRFLVVGLGGIGCPVLTNLAVFLHSQQTPVRLVLVDGDAYEPANTQRMVFQSLGNKAEVKAAELSAMLGASETSLAPVPEYVTAENIARLIRPRDTVFLCVDNHPTRKLVSDHCQTLSDVALFSGGNEGVEPPRERGTYGNVQVFVRRDDRDLTVPITRYHPEIANPKGKMPGELNCGQLALSTPQILFTNLAVGSALLSAFFAFLCGRLTYQEVKLDILDARMLPQFPVVLPAPLTS